MCSTLNIQGSTLESIVPALFIVFAERFVCHIS
nr:MAG TPA_asm: hypothetical protein [Caudoviricetes sp.]